MIQISYRDPRPIYEQVKDGFRTLILTGVLHSDEKMPSVRELAVQAKVNPNTAQRALGELEEEGLLYTERTNGKFVTRDEERIRRERENRLAGEGKGRD